MIWKIILVTLFAVCQAASNEPWWIRLFFPGVSFTGKYHPSNYKAEKSPYLPEYAQNSNDVWSPAYWMPYKLAYAQYWVDLIDNTTKAEEQAQVAQGSENHQNVDFGMTGQGQQGQSGQMDTNGQFGQNNVGPFTENAAAHTITEEAISLAQEVQTQADKMTQEAELIAAQAAVEAEKQMQAIAEEAERKKQEVQAEAQLINEQAEIVAAQIDVAAQSEIEAIAEESAQLQQGIKRRFADLFEEAAGIIMEATELAEEVAE